MYALDVMAPSKPAARDRFASWFDALEKRHLADLTFREVRRSVQALSTRYVERRGRALEDALSTRGKRAAYALYYAPLHFLTIRAILRERVPHHRPGRIIDLGCGTGVAGAAWSMEENGQPPITAYDISDWAVRESRWNFRLLGLRGMAKRRHVSEVALDDDSAIIAAFAINELSPDEREIMRKKLAGAARRGAPVVIVEPIARRPVPWWEDWASTFTPLEGLAEKWRFDVALPETLRLLDKAAGLRHETLTARSILAGGWSTR